MRPRDADDWMRTPSGTARLTSSTTVRFPYDLNHPIIGSQNERRIFSGMSLLLIASLFTLLTPTLGRPAKPAKDQARPELKDLKVEKGRQVGERVKKLKDTSLNVKAALAEFEKGSGRHLPKLDEAVTFSAKVKGTTTAPVARNPSIFRQASFRPQQSTFTDTGVDVTFITAVDLYNEWQGTVIANFSNAAGVETDIHDLVITRSDYNPSEWTVRYDLIVENGVASIATMPGMFFCLRALRWEYRS